MPSVPKPPLEELERAGLPQFSRWIAQLHKDALRFTRTVTATINPSSVGATSESTQTFTVPGLTTDDSVTVTKPSDTNDLHIRQAWVSAEDTLSIKFYNGSSGAVDAPSETYKIVAVRVTE